MATFPFLFFVEILKNSRRFICAIFTILGSLVQKYSFSTSNVGPSFEVNRSRDPARRRKAFELKLSDLSHLPNA